MLLNFIYKYVDIKGHANVKKHTHTRTELRNIFQNVIELHELPTPFHRFQNQKRDRM